MRTSLAPVTDSAVALASGSTLVLSPSARCALMQTNRVGVDPQQVFGLWDAVGRPRGRKKRFCGFTAAPGRLMRLPTTEPKGTRRRERRQMRAGSIRRAAATQQPCTWGTYRPNKPISPWPRWSNLRKSESMAGSQRAGDHRIASSPAAARACAWSRHGRQTATDDSSENCSSGDSVRRGS